MEPPGKSTASAAKGVPSPLCCLGALNCQTLTWQQQPRVTQVSPAARDVALGVCLGVEELQHHRSALWDFGVGFSGGGRSEVGRAAGEKHKQLSPGCDHQLCPSGSLQSEHSRGSQLQLGHSTSHMAPWHHQPCRTAQHWDTCRTPEPEGAVRAGKTGSRWNQAVTWVRQGGAEPGSWDVLLRELQQSNKVS